MLKKEEIAQIYGDNRYLTTCVSQYTKEKFPRHITETLDQIYERVVGIVNGVKSKQYGVLGFMGLPGSGKTNKMDDIEYRVARALRIEEGVSETDFFSYQGADGMQRGVGGYHGARGHMGKFPGDYFFRALGDDRRRLMLESFEAFRTHWGRHRDWFRTVRSVFAGKEPTTRLYFGSSDERESRTPKGQIRVLTPGDISRGKNIILLEGVNVGYGISKVERLIQSRRIQFTKILFDTSPEYSVIKVLRRDRDAKGYSFEDILFHRVQELFYILPIFIYPVLRDETTIVLQRKTKHIPFTEDEKDEIMKAINFAEATYEFSIKFTEKQRKFAKTLLSNLRTIIGTIPAVSDEELMSYALKKGKNS